MQKQLKALVRRILPTPVLRMIRYYKNPAVENDLKASWKHKEAFFWSAFKALDFNGIDGDYVEFGSFSGMTFRLAFDQIRQRNIKRHLWAFDSFQGLPEPVSPLDHHPGWRKGVMAMRVEDFHEVCLSHGIPRNRYTVVQGFYEETLSPLRDDAAPTNIALAYVDCDTYSSSKTVLEFLLPRLKHGMILAFDDYFCWSAKHVAGERKALHEIFANQGQWNLLPYRDYSWGGRSFVVERVDPSST